MKLPFHCTGYVPSDAATAPLQQQRFSGLCRCTHEAAQVPWQHADKAPSECYGEFHGVQNIRSTI